MQSSKTGLRSLWHTLNRSIPSTCPPRIHSQLRSQSTLISRENLPRILQPSLWETIIPPAVRAKTRSLLNDREPRPYNPASYFIWIYIFIGSQAIRIITVKDEYQTYSRKADLQIDKLREVVRKLLAGEEVDVEKVLGTDVPEEENAWEEALRQIENEERAWQLSKREKREARAKKVAETEKETQEEQGASPVNTITSSEHLLKANSSSESAVQQPPRAPGFY